MDKHLVIKVLPETVPGGVQGLAPEHVLTDAERDELGVSGAQSLHEIERHYGGLVFTQEVMVSEDPDRFEEVHFDLRALADVPPEAKVVLGIVHSYTHEEAQALSLKDPDFGEGAPSR
ncbi:hypothetical protein [Kineococcus terrestris]|uniref:hypothetical protein n=1 Tax=Kineococcus terrestris TaxID=2044856 RepID=UPI0034DAC4EB